MLDRYCPCFQVDVQGGERQVVLKSLKPDTHYSIVVTAEYRNKEGGSASAQGKTSESVPLKICTYEGNLGKKLLETLLVDTVCVENLRTF